MSGKCQSAAASAASLWNAYLRETPDLQAEIDAFADSQRECKALVQGRPLCSVLRPHFASAADYRLDRKASLGLASAVRKLMKMLLERHLLNQGCPGQLDSWLSILLGLAKPEPDAAAILRLDAFSSGGELKFVEVNGDAPEGSAHADMLIPLFEKFSAYAKLSRKYAIRPVLSQIGLAESLLYAFRAFGGHGAPSICALSLDEEPERGNSQLAARFLRGLGLKAVAALPGELTYGPTGLYAGPTRIDLVYRLIHLPDCLRLQDELSPLLKAAGERRVCLVNPFLAELFSHKFLFAMLSDPELEFGLSAQEKEVVARHVPWGRIVSRTKTLGPQGTRIDLPEFILKNQEHLVLKPAHDQGGRGVVLGWRASVDEWARALADCLANDSVVQWRIEVTAGSYPCLAPGAPEKTFYEDTDPFVFPHGGGGILTRVSEKEITNVSQGGSVVPTFIVEKFPHV